MAHRGARLVWFRSDLRTHDHPALAAWSDRRGPAGVPTELLAVYVLPARAAGSTSFGFPKMGGFRARFLRQTLDALAAELRRLGNDLLMFPGDPSTVIAGLCRACHVSEVWYQAEVGTEEADEATAVERALARMPDGGPAVHRFEAQTMYDAEALPFAVEAMPDTFTAVRKKLERGGIVPDAGAPPAALPPIPEAFGNPARGYAQTGDLPRERRPGRTSGSAPVPAGDAAALLARSGIGEREPDERTALQATGGERAGMDRVNQYFWDTDALARYKYTRNGLVGSEYSTKLSPWLACGSLSPRWVHAEVLRYESERTRNVSTYWLRFELTWRDYFNLLMRKYPRDSFRLHGPMRRRLPWSHDEKSAARWREGRTGEPFIDAAMRELAATGYMSNRGRQNVASYLARDLGIDWRMGAEWFESLLVDYDPASNYGNWTYNTGVGTDPRLDRYFNPRVQAEKYDRDGRFRSLWLGT